MGDPLPVTGSQMTRERTRLLHFDLHFIIDGPRSESAAEPYETLATWSPDSTPFNLPEVGRSASKQEDGDWLLIIHVEGLPSGDQGLLVLEIDHSGSEDPIESCPNFLGPNGIWKKWKANFDGERFSGFTRMVKDPETDETVPNPYYGQTHFLNDAPVLRVTFITGKYDPSILWNICKIDTAMVPDDAKPYLQLQANLSWLKRSVRGSFRGNVWEFTVEWLGGRWNADLYMPKQAGQPISDAADDPVIANIP